MDNYFVKLNAVDVSGKTEKKNGLTFLPWAFAWGEVKKVHPDAYYTIYENRDGWNYHTDGRTCWVKTGVTVNGLEHIEYLPVMDYRNASISADKVTSFDVNKAIQRSLTKAAARHGLGLYIYAGEDLPEGAEVTPMSKKAPGIDTQQLKLARMKLIAADVQKYTGSKDKYAIRDGIETAEAWMEAQGCFIGKSYEAMTEEEFAGYLKGLHDFFAQDSEQARAV